MKPGSKRSLNARQKKTNSFLLTVSIGVGIIFAGVLFFGANNTGRDTDNDLIINHSDIDDDNDGIPDDIECKISHPDAVDPKNDALSWDDESLTVFTIGNNTNGMGYQESGFEKDILNSTQRITTDNNPTHTSFSNGSISLGSGSPGLATTTNQAFLSGDDGSGIQIIPPNGASSHSLNIDFQTPVYAFGFDLVDVFDCGTAGKDIITYEIYADDQKILELRGDNVGASKDSYISVFDGNGNQKGSHKVGQNIENFIGFISTEKIEQVRVVATYTKRINGYDYHGMDSFVFMTAYPCRDTDGDGIPDSMDLDSDNDGVPDIVEAGGADVNGDGVVDYTTDTDGDGLADVFETLSGNTSSLFDPSGLGLLEIDRDFDTDNIGNWRDLDSDGDGIADVVEAGGSDTDYNGLIDNFTDTDEDGFSDAIDGDVGNDGVAENTDNALVRTSLDGNRDGIPDDGYPYANNDGTGYPNFQDIDADDDGIVDNTEAQATFAYMAPSASDSDGDGIDNAYDTDNKNFGGGGIKPHNTDLMDDPDYLDLDSDEDLLSDIKEGHGSDGDTNQKKKSPANLGIFNGLDVDEDGLDDGFDNNIFFADPTNEGLKPSSHPSNAGGSDMDWRTQTFLPVEWASIQASWQGTDGLLSWETAMELNSSYFQVERKTPLQENYQALERVSASGNSSQVLSYQYLDTDLKGFGKGDNISYRLKQVDIDGKFEYSKVVELVASGRTMSMQVYPNPARDFVSVKVSGGETGQRLSIYSMSGKVMYQNQLDASQKELRLSLDSWAKGVYVVRLEDDNNSTTSKLVVK